jgi:hypothetical protein
MQLDRSTITRARTQAERRLSPRLHAVPVVLSIAMLFLRNATASVPMAPGRYFACKEFEAWMNANGTA